MRMASKESVKSQDETVSKQFDIQPYEDFDADGLVMLPQYKVPVGKSNGDV